LRENPVFPILPFRDGAAKRPLISRLYYKSPAPSLPYRRTKKKKFFPFSSSLQTAKPLLSAQAARRQAPTQAAKTVVAVTTAPQKRSARKSNAETASGEKPFRRFRFHR
jgi:hypothetical protein